MSATLVFGTDDDATYGVVQNMSDNGAAEIAEARDHVGKVIKQKAYSKSKEKQFEVLFDSGATLPEPGDTVTIDLVEYLVSSCNVTSSNTDFKKASITAVKKDAADLESIEVEEPAE